MTTPALDTWFSTPSPELNRLLQATARLVGSPDESQAGPDFLEALAPVLERLEPSQGGVAVVGQPMPAEAAMGRALREALVAPDRPWSRREVSRLLARVDYHLAHGPGLVKSDLDWGQAFLAAWLEGQWRDPPVQSLFQQVVAGASRLLGRPAPIAA